MSLLTPMPIRPERHKFLMTFDEKYENTYNKLSRVIQKQKTLRNLCVKTLVTKCFPFLLPLQIVLYVGGYKSVSFAIAPSYLLGVILFYLVTQVNFLIRENNVL